ncbi:nuclear transport factor 2 family protein [Planctomonas sp. JC2975]|uniref:nuclear transport factor 2 family protein n=1 Tax=Planctomonas sp. JC2975 TaxID=2729626 RepID=UPI001474E5A0|nr:nuclear transport factor 2 family protein [Planctomonas sp. JC2975]NNC13545.1 nuclear transport factor 2 family protein [Planctomonas sp. JC2975]
MDTTSPAGVARAYIEAVGAHDLDAVEALLAESLEARVGTGSSDKAQWLAALGRLLPALERNDIRDVYENGDHACVVYDFVTSTPAGAVVCVENLRIADGRITDIELIFDKVAFAPVNEALRAGIAASA